MKKINFKVFFALCLLGNLGLLWAIWGVQSQELDIRKRISAEAYKKSELDNVSRLLHEWDHERKWLVRKMLAIEAPTSEEELTKLADTEGWLPFAVDGAFVWYRKPYGNP